MSGCHVTISAGPSDSLEWVSLIWLLDGLQDAFVYPEADGYWEQSQADVGAHADDAAHHQGEEEQQGGAEHNACGLHITPVEEIHHCRRKRRRRLQFSASHPQRSNWAAWRVLKWSLELC